MTRLYRAFACFCLFSLLAYAVSAQDTSIAFGPERARWFRIAQEVQPVLRQTVVEPVGLVRPVRDSSAFQGWRMEPAGDMQRFYDMTYKRGTPSVIVDFGRHVTGYFSFSLHTDGWSDAPTRFPVHFRRGACAELTTPFDPYPGGLSRGWLQDEIVTVMTCPEHITVPIDRRMAFRYVKIEIAGCVGQLSIRFHRKMRVRAVSSASGTPMELAASTPGNDSSHQCCRACHAGRMYADRL
ncbi:MAG: hypothetical protein ACLR8Y_21305 [Alistipes indistinctus]